MVELTRAVEDYLKTVYHLTARGGPATIGALAHEMGVASPSATAMVRRLEDGGLVARPDARSLRLTADGEAAALRVVRRHRLLETFLARVLDVPWDEVHDEAELLEHALSERLEERIDAKLGHPACDPHGDPIPPRHGSHREDWGLPLRGTAAGCRFRVGRVSDRDSAALRHLGLLGVVPGAVLVVEEQAPFGGPLWIRVGEHRHPLGEPLVHLVHGTIEGDGHDRDE